MKKRMERVRQLAEEKRAAANAAKMRPPVVLAAPVDAVDKLQAEREAARAEEMRKVAEKRAQEEALLQRAKDARNEARKADKEKKEAALQAQREDDK